MHTSLVAYGAVAFTVLSWASAFPLIRLALNELAPIPLAAARFAIAAVLVVAWLLRKRPPLPAKSDALRIFLCGLFGVALYNITLNTGQQTVSPGAAAFIVNSAPILTALFALFVLKERFTIWGWIGTLISFSGIAVIASGQPGGLSFGAGTTFVLAAAVSTGTYFVLQKPLVGKYGALPCAAYTMLIGALLLSPWLPGAATLLATTASNATLWSVIALGILPAALGYATWTYALGYFGAARGSNFLYLIAPVATVLAFLFMGVVPGVPTIIGGALAILGVVIVNTRGRA
jgi:drug/metabolite transporter (DMT)-like permease